MSTSVTNPSLQSNSITAGRQSQQDLGDLLYTRPILWTSDPIATDCLSQYFQIAIAKEDLKPGHHIIALENELQIRQLNRKLQGIEGTQIQIYQLENPRENFLAGIGESAAPMVLTDAVSYSDWLKSLLETPLELEKAVELIKDVLETTPDELEANLALETLRQRVSLNMGRQISSWEWDKKYVEPLKNATVTGDTSFGSDSSNAVPASTSPTVTTVTEILQSGFPEWIELNKLEQVRLSSGLTKEAFTALVKTIKSQFDEVQPEDEVRLRSLINWHNTELDFYRALPSMAEDILHDAKVLNIDPIGIWQYLLPAVLSLAGKRVNLDLQSHEIPAIAWTALIAESGTGKTRAEKLVTSPLKQLQKEARERFIAELEEWEETIANWEKGSGKKPQQPVERKYLFDVATIQAVMKRQSEQGMNGSLWARDELIGIFQSFGQFNKGENEALSCLLASWDGGSSQVDRVNQEDSFFIEASRLSIAGGLQPGVFKEVFKDANDSQGLLARFLPAAMKPKKPKRVKGFCRLSEKLPPMYRWLDSLPEGKIKLSTEADEYYDKLYEQIGEQAINTAMPAIRAWMFKLPGQLLRIALGLHLIECYHEKNRPLWTLQKDTLERAVLFAQYYRSTFHIIQTTAAETDDISAILLQIWDKAITRHPEGISIRDAYRDIKAIQYRAKDAGRPVAAYTADLFGKLAEMGKGSVVKNGRQIKFIANLTPPPMSPNDNDGLKMGLANLGDRVTVAETIDIPQSELSLPSELSPVTIPNDVVSDVLLPEGSEEVEEEISPTPTSLEENESDPWDEEQEAEVIAPTPLEQSDVTLAVWREEVLAEEWKDESALEEMARDLANCSTMMELATYLSCWNHQAVQEACSRLSPEKREQIKGWEKELDKVKVDFQEGDRVFVSTAPHSDGMEPYLIERIEGHSAKLGRAMGRNPRRCAKLGTSS